MRYETLPFQHRKRVYEFDKGHPEIWSAKSKRHCNLFVNLIALSFSSLDTFLTTVESRITVLRE